MLSLANTRKIPGQSGLVSHCNKLIEIVSTEYGLELKHCCREIRFPSKFHSAQKTTFENMSGRKIHMLQKDFFVVKFQWVGEHSIIAANVNGLLYAYCL